MDGAEDVVVENPDGTYLECSVKGPGEMIFEKGTLVEYSGLGIEEIIRNIGDDATGKIIGEFGIGTNPGAKICPNMLEAEKAFGTAHFAIGDSYGSTGSVTAAFNE